MGCIELVRCVLVLRCGLAEALVPQPAYGYHTTTVKPQRNTNTHRTRALPPNNVLRATAVRHIRCTAIFFLMAQQPPVGQGLLIIEVQSHHT